MTAKVSNLVAMLKRQEAEANERGNLVHRFFGPAERYLVDFAPDFTAGGWLQFDTDQDAHYFGVWVNPRLLLTLTYCEGDWILAQCPDTRHYNAEISDAIEFYDEGRICTVIDMDAKTTTRYSQDRSEFLIPA